MSDTNKPMIINAKKNNMSEKDYLEIKANEVLNFLQRYSKLQWERKNRRTRQLFPSFDKINKACHINNIDTVKIIIDHLEEKGEIIRSTSQRYLKWVWEKVLEQRKKQVQENEKKTLPESEVKSEIKPILKKKKLNIDPLTFIDKMKLQILKMIMLVVALIVFYISTYFTYIWFLTMFQPIKSVLLSFSIVATSITSFEMMILFKKDKSFWGAFFFGLLWIGVVSFSVTTGLSGQLNLRIEKKIQYQESNVDDESKILLYRNYESRIQQLNIDLNSIRKEREKLQEFINKSSFDTTNDKREYTNLNYRIYLKNNQITKIRKEIEKIEKEKELLLKENVKLKVTKRVDFFIWLEKVLKISSDKLRFVLYLILAIFVDIISPVNFSIVMFYKRKEVNNEIMA